MKPEDMNEEQLRARLAELEPVAQQVEEKKAKQVEALVKKKEKSLDWWTDPEGKMKLTVKEKDCERTLTHKDCVEFEDGTIVKWSGRGYRKIN